MIDWKTVLLGSILAIILTVILSIIPFGGIIGYLAVTIYVGYTVGGEYANGAKHGAIVSLITGIFMIMIISIGSPGAILESYLNLFSLILVIGLFCITGTLGGYIGAIIKRLKSSKEITT